eukprot:1899566-Prymnesium_polylepis.1
MLLVDTDSSQMANAIRKGQIMGKWTSDSQTRISPFDPFERGAAPPAPNGRLTPFEPFERSGRHSGRGARCGVHLGFTASPAAGTRDYGTRGSLEITLGPIWPALSCTATLQGDRSACDER